MSNEATEQYQIKRPLYESLCSEVQQIIQSSLQKSECKCQSVDARAKALESFMKKAKKTNEDGLPRYKNPIREITDLAGVRVIVYTIDDIKFVTNF